jgi:hypothetical protein
MPAIIAKLVIRMGRSRLWAPSTAASAADMTRGAGGTSSRAGCTTLERRARSEISTQPPRDHCNQRTFLMS